MCIKYTKQNKEAVDSKHTCIESSGRVGVTNEHKKCQYLIIINAIVGQTEKREKGKKKYNAKLDRYSACR